MKVKKVRAITCPECGECVETQTETPVYDAYQCGECEAIYPDKDEAKDCCKE